MDYLKPGGFAVHTTEFNVSSNDSTIDNENIALYRRKDIERIVKTLKHNKHNIDVDFSTGTLPHDLFVDVPPYDQDPHLKLKIESYTATSIGLIIQKKM